MLTLKERDALDITVIVLVLNEERHIQRCLLSAKRFAKRIILVDSGSSDRTLEIGASLGAETYSNEFVSHSAQLNWTIDNISITSKWTMKLDADEYVVDSDIRSFYSSLTDAPDSIGGFTLRLRRIFMGRWLKFGTLYPLPLLRVWKTGCGRAESRIMDEHIVVDGAVVALNVDFADHNLNSIGWWVSKHNRYADLEAAEMLLAQCDNRVRTFDLSRHPFNVRLKKFLKINVYRRLPLGFRAFLYFFYRYVVFFGFLDGREGFAFHFLQAFWYRYLVDLKILSVKKYMRQNKVCLRTALVDVLSIRM
jgi:glycosyltransferase involved in cell wall biosynthesis